MATLDHAPIPSTLDFLDLLKRPSSAPSPFDRIERGIFRIMVALAGLMLGAAGLGALGVLSDEVIRFLTLSIIVIVLALFVAWMASQLIGMILALRAGFRREAGRVDRDIEHDQQIVEELIRCDPFNLRERSRLLEAKARRLTRHAGMGPVIAAIGVVVINFQDSAEKAELFARLKAVPLFVYSGSLGVLLGAAALTVFAGKLEHIAGLLSLAADRTEGK